MYGMLLFSLSNIMGYFSIIDKIACQKLVIDTVFKTGPNWYKKLWIINGFYSRSFVLSVGYNGVQKVNILIMN